MKTHTPSLNYLLQFGRHVLLAMLVPAFASAGGLRLISVPQLGTQELQDEVGGWVTPFRTDKFPMLTEGKE